MALLKDYFAKCEWDSPILYVITAEMVQSFAEDNLGRELTNQEIERVHYSMIENDKAYHDLISFIVTSAEDAMNTNDNDWKSIDENYNNRKTLEIINGYPIGEDN